MPEMEIASGGDLMDILKNGGYEYPGAIDVNPNFDMLCTLPKKVKARISALKGLQEESINIESEFYERVHALEKEFESKYNKIFEERRKVVSGEREATDEEAKKPLILGASEEQVKELEEKSADDKGEVGIPDFWLTVLKTSENTASMIEENDEPILKHLVDITSVVEVAPESGFTLHFHFSENEFFTNKVLTKKYKLQMKPGADDVFDYDGPTVVRCSGDKIDWKDGKDTTKKVIKKKQKKGAMAGKFLTKTVKDNSFFNFFEPPTEQEQEEAEKEDAEEAMTDLLRYDFEAGSVIRDLIIPRAVLFFTGESADAEDFDDFEDEDDCEDEDDEEDEE